MQNNQVTVQNPMGGPMMNNMEGQGFIQNPQANYNQGMMGNNPQYNQMNPQFNQQQMNPQFNQQQMVQQGNFNQGMMVNNQIPMGFSNNMGNMQMAYVPVNPINFMNGLDKLGSLPAVYIKQKFELLEALSGCETENKYIVYSADSQGEKKKIPIFKCREKSGCFSRNCLS